MTTIYWKDFDNEFRSKTNGDVIDMVNIDAIYNSLTNIFETFQGGRRMIPEFALPLYGLLFEPVDEVTARSIAELIIGGIQRWETRVVIDNIDINAQPDQNTYRINLEFRIVNDTNAFNSQLFTYILRAS